MPTHLYCLLPPGSNAAPPAGVRVIDTSVALAWVGDTAEPRVPRDAREAARATVAHDRVIGSALVQEATPIPASLADPYDDDAAALTDVRAHAAEIELGFAPIADMVEMTTIIAMQDELPATDAPARGTAYLEQLRSAPARGAAVADRIAEALRDRFPDFQRRRASGHQAVSHLVPRGAVKLYRALALALSGDGYRLLVDGPRAPYSFVLFSPRRGLETRMWLGSTSVGHDSGELNREE